MTTTTTAGAPGELRIERFLVGGIPAGALLRRLAPGRLSTVLVYADTTDQAGALVHHTSEIVYDGEPERWSRTRYTEAEHGLAVTHSNPDPARPSVPTYADVLVVERMARVRGLDGASYEVAVLHERDGDIEPGTYRCHTRELGTPTGLQADCRVDVLTGAQLHSRHWCLGGVLLASDWMGAFSFRVASLDTALRGVPASAARALRDSVPAT